jgi:hypothetical protein
MPVQSELYALRLKEAGRDEPGRRQGHEVRLEWEHISSGSSDHAKGTANHAERVAYKGYSGQDEVLLFVQNGFPCASVNDNRTNTDCHTWFTELARGNRFIIVHVTDDQGGYSSSHLGKGALPHKAPCTIYYVNGRFRYRLPLHNAGGGVPDLYARVRALPDFPELSEGKEKLSAQERKRNNR